MRSPIDDYLNLNKTDKLPRLPHSPEHLATWEETIGWQPSDSQSAMFEQLYHAILQGNQAYNLTRITEPDEFWEKHLWDSMSGIRAFLNAETDADANDADDESSDQDDSPIEEQSMAQQSLKVIDIGTGCGFPGLPVAIACPAWHVTLLDATRKKTTFLNAAITALQIQNVSTLTERAEAIGRKPQHREQYDVALLRAVSSASVCAEYALPLLKQGGWAILYRGHWTDADTDALLPALEFLGGEIELVDSFKTPNSQGDRHCVILRKVLPTPSNFPRGIGVPTKDPL